MGRLTRLLAPVVLAGALLALGTDAAAAFDGFGASSADSTYGQEIRFTTTLNGDNPDRLELLIRTQGADGSLVVPVPASGSAAEYVWDTSVDYVVPNTLITYQWRAFDGDDVVLSPEAQIRYVDDRPGLDWQSVQLGEATVHWYGDNEEQALHFGELSAIGVDRAEQLLGSEMAGPVDVFVYISSDDFFGALGPGAREWTGAATYPERRTIFMWNSPEAGSQAYLETVMIHEITHIVFHDATDNPFHEPASWLNEGIATWSETQEASEERAIVEQEAAGDGLFSFDAISEQFPIGAARWTALVRRGHDDDRQDHRRATGRRRSPGSRRRTATELPTRRRSRRAPASRPTSCMPRTSPTSGSTSRRRSSPIRSRRRTWTARPQAPSIPEAWIPMPSRRRARRLRARAEGRAPAPRSP